MRSFLVFLDECIGITLKELIGWLTIYFLLGIICLILLGLYTALHG